MATLIGQLQSSMQLGGIAFTVSPELRRQTENELITDGVAAFRARADIATKALGGRSYKIRRVSLNTGGFVPGPRPMAAARMAPQAAEVAPPMFEGGHEHGERGGCGHRRSRITGPDEVGPRRDRRHPRRPDPHGDRADFAVGDRAGRGRRSRRGAAGDRAVRFPRLLRRDAVRARDRRAHRPLRRARGVPGGRGDRGRRARAREGRHPRGRPAGRPRACRVADRSGLRARQPGELAHPRAPHAAGRDGARVLDQADRRADRRCDRRRGGADARPRHGVAERAPGARCGLHPRRVRAAAGARGDRGCAAGAGGRSGARAVRLSVAARARRDDRADPPRAVAAAPARSRPRLARLRLRAARLHRLFRLAPHAAARLEPGDRRRRLRVCARRGHRRPHRVGRGRRSLAVAARDARGARRRLRARARR